MNIEKSVESRLLEQLGMSPEEIVRIKEMCEVKGISSKRLINQFLCDLVGNEHSGGSDEEMMIGSWYSRSQF